MRNNTKKTSVHLEIQTSRHSPVGVIRNSYRESGVVRHENLGRVTGKTVEELKILQAAFRNEVTPNGSPEELVLLGSKEYGASRALLQLAKKLGLDGILYSRKVDWVQHCLAMIVGRLLYCGSKLYLAHEWENTALWELCGVLGPVHVQKHCYDAMDQLSSRQKKIQQKLAKQNLQDGQLVLYDITSTYFEGEYKNSDLVLFGYNRDGKIGHEQVVVGLLCSPTGCPVGVEVFPGNTQDAATVVQKVKELKTEYALKSIIFVGDRGMLTAANIEKLKVEVGLRTITVLTHRQIMTLLDRNIIQESFFIDNQVTEVIDPEDATLRYCLCKNPLTADHETKTRERLLNLTKEKLAKIAARKKKTAPEKLGAQVSRILTQYKTQQFIDWKIVNQHLNWTVAASAVQRAALIDGCYIVRSDVGQNLMDKSAVVAAYKSLVHVEKAFRNLKTVSIEMRPVYHKKDPRIESHIFLCFLAYYLQWQMTQRLMPLFAQDGQGSQRRWTIEGVIERLKAIRSQKLKIGTTEFSKVTTPDADQKLILDLLEVEL